MEYKQTNKKYKPAEKEKPVQADLSDFVFGKLPPHSQTIEESVLGALIYSEDVRLDFLGDIQPNFFYIEKHRILCTLLKSMFADNSPIDMATIAMESVKRKIGIDAYFVVELCNRITSTANTEYHVRILKQHYILRETIAYSTEIIRKAYDNEDPFDLLAQVATIEEKLLTEINGDIKPKSVKGSIRSLLLGERKLLSLTGVKSLDDALGFVEGTGAFGIVTAAPGVGKSVLQNNLFLYAFLHGLQQMHISFETQQEQLVLKAAAAALGGVIYDDVNGSFGVSYEKIRRGVTTKEGQEGQRFLRDSDVEKILEFVEKIEAEENPCKLVYMPAQTLDSLIAIIKRNAKKGVKVFTIDRAELVRISKTVEEYSQLFSRLRSVAIELGVIIILFAQQSGAGRGGMEIAHASEARNSAQFFLMIERDGENERGMPTPLKIKVIKNSLGMDGEINADICAHYDRQVIWEGTMPDMIDIAAYTKTVAFTQPSNIIKKLTASDTDIFTSNDEVPF